MIEREEIDQKSQEFDVKTSDVQRDYVFGWFLKAVFENDYLRNRLILKGGNAFRKAYFAETRFSRDLDFSLREALDIDHMQTAINEACAYASVYSGIDFDVERNRLKHAYAIDKDRQSYKGQVYFKDFYGNPNAITISIRLDITEFDKLLIEPRWKPLIHPYSDGSDCQSEVFCMSLEELVANKLKCLIQRRHTNDLFDLVYATYVQPPEDFDRGLVTSTFLRKTIFQGSPGSARETLLGIPMDFFRGAWDRYIVCPIASRIDFESVSDAFQTIIASFFQTFGIERKSAAFIGPEFRNLILEAGSAQKLLFVTYGGVRREVEPYALSFKRRKDGQAFEYFYGYDRTGGTSGEGIKAFLPGKIENVEAGQDTFDPRFEIELGKAGEHSGDGYFSKQSSRGIGNIGRRKPSARRTRSVPNPYATTYKVQCASCGKVFTRKTASTALKKHKTPAGWDCYGRVGFRVF
ncbi:MAG: nucleotidyl transferase AbiEii/AbiGii toxin family protein [Pseudomonadota bacterium]